MRFPEWVKSQPHGTLKRIERETGVGYNTLARLNRGETINRYDVAEKISEATDRAVSIDDLCRSSEDAPKRKATGTEG